MLSVLLPVRNSRGFAAQCLRTLGATFDAMRVDPASLQFVLVDDFSDPDQDIPGLFRQFQSGVRAAVKILRFKSHQHYTHSVAYGLSACTGDAVLFISHDMVVPPSRVTMLMKVAEQDASIGLVRPSSRHMDGTPQHVITPPPPVRSYESIVKFSEYVATTCGTEFVQDHLFIGDAFLVKRTVLDRIGVFDTRFRGFLADLDYGLRAQRAGFKVGTAVGAWLHHEGSGYVKETIHLGKGEMDQLQSKHAAEVDAAFAQFRAKWGPAHLPRQYLGLDSLELHRLREIDVPESLLYFPPPVFSADVVEQL